MPEVGVEGDPFEMVVEAGKVAEFAIAVGADRTLGVPPTFLEAARFWRRPGTNPWVPDPDLLSRILHASQEYEFPQGPLRIGTRLTGRMRIEDVIEKSGRRSGKLTFIEVVTRFEDEAGSVVAVARQSMAITERPPETEAA